MVFFNRKKKEEAQKLLDRPKGLFGRRRDESASSDKAKAGSKRAVRMFAKDDSKHGTPTGSPDSPFNVTVLTTPPSPERLDVSREEEQEMTEMNGDQKVPDSPLAVYSSSLIQHDDATEDSSHYDETATAGDTTAGEATAEHAAPTMACTSDATNDVVAKILGMMDEACSSAADHPKNANAHTSTGTANGTADPSTAAAAVSRGSDLAAVMSTVFSGVMTRRPTTTAGEPSSSAAASGGVDWGVPPSKTEDDETTHHHANDTREALEESLEKNRSAEGAPSSRDAAAATEAAAGEVPPQRVEHEEFELVLNRQTKEPASILRRRNWLQRGREYQEEKKEEDLAKSARYKAVFGADPQAFEPPKKKILPGFVKRLSLTGKPSSTTGTKPQQQQPQVRPGTKSQSGVVSPNTSSRSIRPGLEMEESLRGVHYLEEEHEDDEEGEPKPAAATTKPAVVSPEIEKVNFGPIPINESKRSRSWNQKMQSLVGSSNEDPVSNEAEQIPPTPSSSLPRTRSSPMRLLGFGGSLKPPKPTWKAAVDPTTGVPYYYHRMTRQTTWTKPKDYDKQYEQWENFQQLKKNGGVPEDPQLTTSVEVVSKQTPALNQQEEKRFKSRLPAGNHIDVSAVLRKKSPRDFIPDVWDNKQKIVRLLTIMNPPNAESVEKLMKQYEGREDELLSALDELVESQPFDEPMQTEGSLASSEVLEDVSALPEMVPTEAYTSSRIRTEATATSGFLSQKTEQTEKHRNTAPAGYSSLAFDQHAPLSTSTSFSSNLESHEDIPREEPSPSKKNVQVNYQGSNRLKLPTVPRDRELVVEEFTTSRLKKENYDVGSRPTNRRGSLRDEAESSYNGDNDETDDAETYGEDSISALSEVDGDFQRREHLDLVRQRLVEEANVSRLAQKPARGRVESSEWKQSELDKFISENGWDAVASYVSKLKEEDRPSSSSKVSPPAAARATGARQETPKSETRATKIHHPPFAQRKLGGRSQLQHSQLRDDSSCESESSYESDDYTETSYESDDPSSLTESKAPRKEFVC